ncbi:MAG: DNA helicase UvrD, partial [Acutalibacteraceae bacterium]
MSNPTVAISADFLAAFATLPRQKQGRVMDFISKFRSNPRSPGINYEKIHNSFDPNMYSVRIDDTYRGIVMRQEKSGVYLLLWVDHHDRAYEWASRK